jgi:hypothetical protein
VWLTEQERRVLHAIEDALTAEDPTLALLLRGPALPVPESRPGPERRMRRIARAGLAVAVALLVLGLVLADPGLQSAGAVLLLPVALWRVAATLRRRRR